MRESVEEAGDLASQVAQLGETFSQAEHALQIAKQGRACTSPSRTSNLWSSGWKPSCLPPGLHTRGFTSPNWNFAFGAKKVLAIYLHNPSSCHSRFMFSEWTAVFCECTAGLSFLIKYLCLFVVCMASVTFNILSVTHVIQISNSAFFVRYSVAADRSYSYIRMFTL